MRTDSMGIVAAVFKGEKKNADKSKRIMMIKGWRNVIEQGRYVKTSFKVEAVVRSNMAIFLQTS